MRQLALGLAAICLCPATAFAQPVKIDRSIANEPVYKTKTPKYGLLVFGPEAKDRVWMVLDGDVLYVDRNGNGDLTEAEEMIAAEKDANRDPDDHGHTFDIGEIKVGGRVHKGLIVAFAPLKPYAEGAFGDRPDVKAALAQDAGAVVAVVALDVEVPGLKEGVGGRAHFMAGPVDLTGVLQFAETPAAAPVIHMGGPLHVTFYGEVPSLRVGRETDLIVVVGTPGIGAGTFALLWYESTIPGNARPIAHVSLPPSKPGEAPLKETYELKVGVDIQTSTARSGSQKTPLLGLPQLRSRSTAGKV